MDDMRQKREARRAAAEQAGRLAASLHLRRPGATQDKIFAVVLPLIEAGIDGSHIEWAVLEARTVSAAAVDYMLATIRSDQRAADAEPHCQILEFPMRDDPERTTPVVASEWIRRCREVLRQSGGTGATPPPLPGG